MTFTNTSPGMMRVVCNGPQCSNDLQQTAENRGVNSLDFMRAAGWTIGSSLCPDCQDGNERAKAAGWTDSRPEPRAAQYNVLKASRGEDPWEHAVETAPGVWKTVPESNVKAPPAKRRRKIRKLV